MSKIQITKEKVFVDDVEVKGIVGLHYDENPKDNTLSPSPGRLVLELMAEEIEIDQEFGLEFVEGDKMDYPQPIVDAFAAVLPQFRMEQIPEEIWPFAEWLWNRHPHNVLEIGVRHGGTSALWHGLCTGRVIGIDWTGTDSLGHETWKRANELESAYPRFRSILGDSHSFSTHNEAWRALNDGGFPVLAYVDFLFIDGDHSYNGVKLDYELYSHLVNPGGCIAFHDIVDTPTTRGAGQGVFRFWNELKAEYPGQCKEFCVNGEWGGIGAIIKP